MAQAGKPGLLPYLLLQGSALPEWARRSDSELLSEYVQHGSELAFAALVQRHGAMVWNVCFRLLRHYHDSEDAFQATFLVLAKRASDIRPPEMLANWLYGVARHTAQKARSMAAKRRSQSPDLVAKPSFVGAGDTPDDDLVDALYEELACLPKKFRTVIVLCDLEGQSRKEAARQLKVPEGTVAGWLARARQMLSRRLAKRGLTLAAASIPLVLAPGSSAAPYAAIFHTVRAASLLCAGQSLAEAGSVKVAVLVSAVLRSLPGMHLALVATGGVCLVATMLVVSASSSWFGNTGHVVAGTPQMAQHFCVPRPTASDTEHVTNVQNAQALDDSTTEQGTSAQQSILPEPIWAFPKEKRREMSKDKPEFVAAKKAEPAKAKSSEQKKWVAADDDADEENRKVQGSVSEINWREGTLTLQRKRAWQIQEQTYRLGRTARVWHKGKWSDVTMLTRGMYVELELSPKDRQILLVKLKPRPKLPEEKKT